MTRLFDGAKIRTKMKTAKENRKKSALMPIPINDIMSLFHRNCFLLLK